MSDKMFKHSPNEAMKKTSMKFYHVYCSFSIFSH